jgi:hypothetical protein
MPEAAVDKYYSPVFGKYQIGLAGQIAVVQPISKPPPVKT